MGGVLCTSGLTHERAESEVCESDACRFGKHTGSGGHRPCSRMEIFGATESAAPSRRSICGCGMQRSNVDRTAVTHKRQAVSGARSHCLSQGVAEGNWIMRAWGVAGRQQNRRAGVNRCRILHLVWEHQLRLFRSRRECRKFIEERYGYIRRRPELRAKPYGWLMPIAVRVVVRRETR